MALTSIVSILDLGGVLCAILAQLASLFAGISSQGLAGDRFV